MLIFLHIIMKKSKLCGIYCIRKDDQFYVGQSINIFKRFIAHKNMLERNEHYNQKLQNSYTKYGGDVFSFEIIEICSQEVLTEKEQYWADTLDATNSGFNVGLIVRSMAGTKRTDEQKQKMRGRIVSEETREKLRLINSGRKHSDEAKRNMSAAQIKRNIENPPAEFSDEARLNMSIAQKKRLAENPAALGELLLMAKEASKNRIGSSHTEETKNKIREKKLARPPHSEETLKKMANTMRQNRILNGPTKRSDEARKRMSEAQKRVAEQNRARKNLLSEEELIALAERKKTLRDKNNKNRNEKRKAQRAEARMQKQIQEQDP